MLSLKLNIQKTKIMASSLITSWEIDGETVETVLDFIFLLPCPSLSPGVCTNSHPLNQWCHPTILSSVSPFSSCLQSFPASGSFPVSQLFASGSQSIAASYSASVLPKNIQGSFSLGLILCFTSFSSHNISSVEELN